MSRRTSELHVDWLRLVEPEGQFLTLPVLQRAFPNGLEAIQSSIRDQLRDRNPHGLTPTQVERDAWIEWLFRAVLAWGRYYRAGEDVAPYAHAVPEHNIVLRADCALCDPQTDKARVLVMRYPHGTPLDKRLAGERWNTSPIDRLMLLCRAQGVRIGIVTDGESVVLVWVPTVGTGGYATWETALFIESRERGLLQSFASLLHASRFFAVPENVQLEALFESSEKAQNDVTDQLGFQIRQAVELLVTALSRANLERGGALLAGISPQTVYEGAVTVMMRLVFLLYAEERDLLPLSEPLYADYYAASTLREQLDEQAAFEGDEPLERRGAAWYRLLALFRIIFAGLNHDRLHLLPYGGRLFDPDRFAFLEGRALGEAWDETPSRPVPIDDLTVRAILEAIQTLPIRESGSKERRKLSFRSLDVEQIGHVYEGLLDHGAVRVDSVYVGLVGRTGDEAEIALSDIENAAKSGAQTLVPFLASLTQKSEGTISTLLERGRTLVAGGDPEMRRLLNTVCDNDIALAGRIAPFVYMLRTDLHGLPVVFPHDSLVVKQTRARRDSGTEYTPRELAEEIVHYALEPLMYTPGPRDGVEPNLWKLRSAAELLDLKICDPAVGSGAFLVSACRYLADRVVEAWTADDPRLANANPDDLTLEARRAVVDRCLYGVDRDSMAVEMAKLSLWLITMARERPFSFLDHSIRVGDSLLGVTSLDQIRYFHMDPVVGRSLHGGSLFDVTAIAKPLVDQATVLRRELEAIPNITRRDADAKQRLNEKANELLETVIAVADSLVATVLHTAVVSEKQRNAAHQATAIAVRAALDPASETDARNEAVAALRSGAQQMLNAGRQENGPPRVTFHWALAFPEVFDRAGHRAFDVIVGNPPFMGGKKISGAFGRDMREFLAENIADGRKGVADLVSYFFLRASTLAEAFGFIAVNTIAQGDTREVGLDSLVSNGWRIVRATKSRPWPGTAGVHISQVWLSRRAGGQPVVLDGLPVNGILPLLMPLRRLEGNPFRLASNAGIAFIGSLVLGMGFTMPPEEAAALIQRDPKNKEVLFPFLNADDLCSRPDASPSRWIINFFDWPLDKASEFAECIDIVRRHVKPQRDENKKANYRDPWWKYAERRPGLHRAISTLDQVIVMPLHSKVVLPLKYPTAMVFSHAVAVIARDDDKMFGVLSSTVHRCWVRKYTGTLETRTRYAPSDCFETFPFPSEDVGISDVIHKLHEYRAQIMSQANIGLTSLYNRINNEDDTDPRISELRTLHADLDRAVSNSYGWTDLDLEYGFHATDEGLRWTIGEMTRNELLDRLLELNYKRHNGEVEQGLLGEVTSSANGKRKRGKKGGATFSDLKLILTGDHG